MRIRRRHELANIKTLGDVNELSISGHVEQQPTLREDYDREHVCEFVLTHTTASPSGHWELQYYNVEAYGQLGEHCAASWQPGQAIVIDGRVEYGVCATLAGPLASALIIAHCIDPALGPHPHADHHQQTNA